MQNGGPGPELSGRALLTCVEMDGSAQHAVELEQAISSLEARYTGEDRQEIIEPLWNKDVFLIDEEGNTVIKTCALAP
jgi:hypothetical protein